MLICDTDLHVIKVWGEHKYKRCDKWILNQVATRKYDHYLLTGIDIEWQYDAQREHPSAAMRQYFYDLYKDIVQQTSVPFTEISGDHDSRLHQALYAVSTL
jgi:nicotinamide riboside kinase